MPRPSPQIARGASSRKRAGTARRGNARSGGGRRFLPSFLAGAAVGVAATIFVVLGLSPEAPLEPAQSSEHTNPEPFAFDFFEVLVRGQSEPVVVHDASPLVPAEQGDVPEATEYLLQAGSFRLRDDAERMRGWLMLYSGLPDMQGLSVTASAVELQEQGTWHRVLIGPFPDRAAVDEAMTHLRQRDVATLLLERPSS